MCTTLEQSKFKIKSNVLVRVLLFLILLSLSYEGLAQNSSIHDQIVPLFSQDSVAVNQHWNELRSRKAIPLASSDSVVFLYRGDATSISWMGDFNGWGSDQSFQNKGTKINNTNIWFLKASFPSDARLDYKLVVDGQWMLDPENKNQQWSGVGGGSPNSELRMPGWKQEPYLESSKHVAQGALQKDILFTSKTLGYQLTYSLYLPAEFDKKKYHSILYVTDGYEYLHDSMGNMKTILNNLIDARKISPPVVVFVDNRDPNNRSDNRRMQELAMNEKYLSFFVSELVPDVETQLGITVRAEQRAIIGTSMGGLSAAYFAFARPDVFGLAGIQSPAFWVKPEIYTLCANSPSCPVRVFLSTGTIHDRRDGAEKMKTILEENTCTFLFKEVNQGHSWGNWKGHIDDMLIYFFPSK